MPGGNPDVWSCQPASCPSTACGLKSTGEVNPQSRVDRPYPAVQRFVRSQASWTPGRSGLRPRAGGGRGSCLRSAEAQFRWHRAGRSCAAFWRSAPQRSTASSPVSISSAPSVPVSTPSSASRSRHTRSRCRDGSGHQVLAPGGESLDVRPQFSDPGRVPGAVEVKHVLGVLGAQLARFVREARPEIGVRGAVQLSFRPTVDSRSIKKVAGSGKSAFTGCPSALLTAWSAIQRPTPTLSRPTVEILGAK